jgi:predicted ArsR family transcriptional regulator
MDGERAPNRTIRLTDPRAMRAYAHPVRLELIRLVRGRGPITATQAAAALGESSGTCSFHLRQLARYGLVEEAGGGRGREKPWRATGTFTEIPPALEGPGQREAQHHLDAILAESYLERITRWLDRRDADPPEWRHAAGYGDLTVSLTLEELRELRRGAEAFLDRHRARVSGAEPAPEGARPVTLVLWAFPDDDPAA